MGHDGVKNLEILRNAFVGFCNVDGKHNLAQDSLDLCFRSDTGLKAEAELYLGSKEKRLTRFDVVCLVIVFHSSTDIYR